MTPETVKKTQSFASFFPIIVTDFPSPNDRPKGVPDHPQCIFIHSRPGAVLLQEKGRPTFRASKVTGKSHGYGMEPLKTSAKKRSWIFCIQTTLQNAQEHDTWKLHTCPPQPIPVSLPGSRGTSVVPRRSTLPPDAEMYQRRMSAGSGLTFVRCTELQWVISAPITQGPITVEQGGPP